MKLFYKLIVYVLCGLLPLCCLAQSPGGINTGLTAWFKANSGNVTYNPSTGAVSQWKNESGTYTLTQATTSRQPVYRLAETSIAGFNFNPFLQFSKSNSTLLANTATSPDLLGNNGTVFLVINTNNTISETNPSGFTYSNGSSRYQYKPGFRIQTGDGLAGSTLDYYNWAPYPSGQPTYPTTSGIILMSKGVNSSVADNSFRGCRNGDSISITNTYSSIYNPAISGGMYVGGNNNSEMMSCAVAEIVLYNAYLSEADQNKVESYLAVKYGITLTRDQSTVNRSYTAPSGTVFWDAAANAAYPFNITVIGRDDQSALLQKQSRSAHNNAVLYLYNGAVSGSFPVSNSANTTTIGADASYLAAGDNGAALTLTACSFNNKMPRLARTWKVQQTGSGIGTVTLAADAAALPAAVKNLLVSSSPTFDAASTTVIPLQLLNNRLYTTLSLTSGQYFTFAADSLTNNFTVVQPACTNPSGGSAAAAVSGGNAPYTYAWNTTPAQTTATASNLAAGNYTVTVTNTGGCAAVFGPVTLVAPISVSVNPTADKPVICEGETVNLAANATGGSSATTYTWTPGSNPSAAVIAVQPATNTTYTVIAQDAGCTATGTVMVTVNKKPTAGFSVAKAAVCVSVTNNITYTGTAGASALYNWNFGGATVQSGANAGPYAIQYASGGTKTVTLSVTENGCTSATATQTITVNEPPSTNFTLSDNVVCSGAAVDVTYAATPDAGASATWQWDGGTVSSGSGFGPFRVVYNQTTPTGIVLTVQDKNGVCIVSSLPKTVTVTQQPSAAFTADLLMGCPDAGGLTVQFTNQTGNTTPGTTTYLWDFGDGGTSAAVDPAYTYTAAAPQTYQVRLTATTGSCTSVSPAQTMTLVPKPKADFVAAPGIGVPVQLSQATFNFTNQSQDATLYRWDFGNTATSSLTNPVYTYTGVGDYTVTLVAVNAVGCTDTVKYGLFKVIPDSTLRIPNVFSPNGDGTHDTWVITGLQGYPTADVRVFNRWGQQVFGSKGYAAPWNGTAKGERLPVGTYYYVIVANNIRYAGWVMILR